MRRPPLVRAFQNPRTGRTHVTIMQGDDMIELDIDEIQQIHADLDLLIKSLRAEDIDSMPVAAREA